MQAILTRNINTMQTVDKKGFIKRDIAAERKLTNLIQYKGVINFDLDDFMKEEEEEEKRNQAAHNNNQEKENGEQNKGNLSKLYKIKDIVIKNPFLKQIIRETKHFISKKSASLKEYFNFAAMNPFSDNNNNQNINDQQADNENKEKQQSNLTKPSQNQNQINNQQRQSNSLSVQNAVQGQAPAISESSIGSNMNRVSQNDSMSISSRIDQFRQEQQTQIRQKEERRNQSLNLSFRSVSNNFNRNSIPSIKSETLQNNRQNKLMESIILQNQKKIKTSQDELSSLPLNKSHSIRFQNITNGLENGDFCDDETFTNSTILKNRMVQSATQPTSKSNNKSQQQTPSKYEKINKKQKNFNQHDDNYDINQNHEENQQKQKESNNFDDEYTITKSQRKMIKSMTRSHIQLKNVQEMKKVAKKMNINQTDLSEQILALQNNKSKEQNKNVYTCELSLTEEQKKQMDRIYEFNCNAYLVDPEVLLKRESLIYAPKQGDSRLNNSSNRSNKGYNQQRNGNIGISSFKNSSKTKHESSESLQKNSQFGAIYENDDSQSEQSYSSSSQSCSNSLSLPSKQQKDTLVHQPFDDECSVSSIQRHTDDDDSAVMMNIFPTSNVTPVNNGVINIPNNPPATFSQTIQVTQSIVAPSQQTNNSQSTISPSSQLTLFKKPLEKKMCDEQGNGSQNNSSKNLSSDANTNENENTNSIFGTVPIQSKEENRFINLEQTSIFNQKPKETAGENESNKAPTQSSVLGLFGNLTKESNNKINADVKPTPQPETQSKPASGSLFSNLIPQTNTTQKSNQQSSSLFSGLTSSQPTESKPKSTGLFANLEVQTDKKPSGLFAQLPTSSETAKPSSLFSQTNTESTKPSTLFPQQNTESTKPSTLFPSQPAPQEASKSNSLFPAQPASQEAAKPTSLFSAQPASQETSKSNSLFASQPASQEASKPNTLFSAQPASTETSKPSTLFPSQNTTESPKLMSLFGEQSKTTDSAKPNTTLFQQQPASSEPAQASTLFSFKKDESNNSTSLFSQLPQSNNQNTSSNIVNQTTPIKNNTSLFGQVEQKPLNGQIEAVNKDIPATNSNTQSLLFNQSSTLGNLQNENKTNDNNINSISASQILSTPQPSLNNANSNIINPFGVTNSSPFSQNVNPFSAGTQQQKQPLKLEDLVKNNSMNFSFQQTPGNSQISNTNEQVPQNNQSTLFSNPQNSLFQQNPTTNSLFQPTSNSIFQSGVQSSQFQLNMPTMGTNSNIGMNQNNNMMNNSMNNNGMMNNNMNNNMMNNNMNNSMIGMNNGMTDMNNGMNGMNNNMNGMNNSMISSFNQPSLQPFSQMGMGNQNNNNLLGNQNMLGSQNLMNSSNNNNNFYQQNSNLMGNGFSSFTQSPAPTTNFFGNQNNNNTNSTANNLFSSQNQSVNSFMTTSTPLPQTNFFGNNTSSQNQNQQGMIGQTSLFSQTSMTTSQTSQSNGANRKKGNNKQRIF